MVAHSREWPSGSRTGGTTNRRAQRPFFSIELGGSTGGVQSRRDGRRRRSRGGDIGVVATGARERGNRGGRTGRVVVCDNMISNGWYFFYESQTLKNEKVKMYQRMMDRISEKNEAARPGKEPNIDGEGLGAAAQLTPGWPSHTRTHDDPCGGVLLARVEPSQLSNKRLSPLSALIHGH